MVAILQTTFQILFLYENCHIFNPISLKFVSNAPIRITKKHHQFFKWLGTEEAKSHNGICRYSNNNALTWMPHDLTDGRSTLVQVMAWCCQAPSHYLSQRWSSSMSPYGVTRPQWVNTACVTDNDSFTLAIIPWNWTKKSTPWQWGLVSTKSNKNARNTKENINKTSTQFPIL